MYGKEGFGFFKPEVRKAEVDPHYTNFRNQLQLFSYCFEKVITCKKTFPALYLLRDNSKIAKELITKSQNPNLKLSSQ